ncbi:SPOR domain-containing protein [Xinfangfangia sp. D13-10-4-6]|uniref:SPOR domain-containing protein n=1 Tax=Pseudogemmobacter hezensis TaxID=2737662 RepID=UPI0015573846|nr:SPOR domain-containing protein [Pseudogemmobacter hezensis]NPD14580.1 SPOR domain-containing protein [Pseudogemmobacter hezensis]
MSGKVFSAAFLVVVSLAATANADLRGPAELPPSGYNGQQYVDSRGCVFLRAGHGGRQTWVPRVSRDRKQLCGFAPSGRAVETAESAPAVVVPPVAATTPARTQAGPTSFGQAQGNSAAKSRPGAPLPLPGPMQSAYDRAGGRPAGSGTIVTRGQMPAPAIAAAAPRVAAPAPGPTRAAAAAAASSNGYRIACPASAPVPQRFRVEDGGTRTLCTRGDGTLAGATFPRLVEGRLAGRDIGPDSWSGVATSTTTGQRITVQPRYATARQDMIPTPPPGYKLAWDDDRLNPNRGKQTTKGIADQEKIWSRTSPAVPHIGNGNRRVMLRLRDIDGNLVERPGIVIATAADGTRTVRLLGDGQLSKSSKSSAELINVPPAGQSRSAAAPAQRVISAAGPSYARPPVQATAPAASGQMFVQVGTFGVASNAEGTAGRLRGMGLPVARSTLRGGALQVVYAGPFASAGEASAALSQVRGAGFGDAILIR